MSLLDTASLIVTPNGYKEGKLYSVIPSDGSGDMSVTRATTATRVNSAGLVELVPYNLLLNTNTFSSWNLEGGTLTSGFTAPDGSSTAYKYVPSSGGLWAGLNLPVMSAGTGATQSIWVKSVSGSNVTFNFGSGYSNQGVSNKTATSQWQLFTNSFAFSDGGSMYVSNISDPTNGIYVWHPQLVEGTSVKEYFPTIDRLNIPRLDYSNGTCPSLLVEPQRTNLVTYSSSFDNAAWVKLNGSVTANIAISPSGIQDADSFIPNTTSGVHALRSNNFNQSSTASHSWFLKANGYSKIAVRESDLVGNYASFDLSNGTLISTNQTGSIESYGNGWYRCTLVDTTTGAGAQTSIVVLPDSYTTGDPLIAWSGDGIKGVFAYGAQAEVGSYATSYIPTTSASVTRNADRINKTGISSLIGQTEGTIFLDFYYDLTNNTLPSSARFQLSDGSTNNWILVSTPDAGTQAARLYVNNNGNYVSLFSATNLIAGRNKVAIGYKSGQYVLYLNGVLSNSSTSSVVVPATSRLDFSGNVPDDPTVVKSNFNAAALWKTRLTNTQLAQLTTI